MSAQTKQLEPPIEEQDFEEYEDEEEDEKGLSGFVVLLMGIVMLAAFTSIVFIAYRQGVKHAQNDASVPVIAAQPLKIEKKPAELAGNERAVYDRVDNANQAPQETLAARPEEPVDRNVADPIGAIASASTTAAAKPADDAFNDRIEQLAKADEATLGVATKPAETVVQPPPPHAQATPAALPARLPVTEPTPAKVEAKPEPPKPAPAAAAPSRGPALSGTHLVQVGAFGSESEANGVWSKLEKRLGDYVSGKGTDIERADLGAKGVYYRLRVGPFASSSEAKTFCDGLKSRGQDCIVKAK